MLTLLNTLKSILFAVMPVVIAFLLTSAYIALECEVNNQAMQRQSLYAQQQLSALRAKPTKLVLVVYLK